MNERLKEFMRINKLTAFEVAEKVMMSKYSVEKYVQPVNPNRISARFIAAFLEAYPQVNKEWFLEGKGEMINEDKVTHDKAESLALDTIRTTYKRKALCNRLRLYLGYRCLTTEDVAKKMNMSKYTIDQYINGYSALTDRFLEAFLSIFHEINRDWLINGEGEMLNNENSTPGTTSSDLTIEKLYKDLLKHHEEETRALHVELDKANSIIERLTDILAKK